MNPPLTYTPTYIGLFAALWLSLVCNAFLDIQYGHFPFEIGCWAALHGWTLWVARQQRGIPEESAGQKQKAVLLFGVVAFLLVLLPIWGPLRAVVYFLAILQAAQNCVSTTRRHLYLGLLVSAVLVMFAASHPRADWTMLFYLLPYIAAAVFTLVSEQISRRAALIRQDSLQPVPPAGLGIAIAAASALIVGVSGLLYLLTPQPTLPYLQSKYGQPGNLGWIHQGKGNQAKANGEAGGTEDAPGQGGESAADGSKDTESSNWPTPAQMREAAARPGMPAWQSSTISQLADWSEIASTTLTPIANSLKDLLDRLRDWLQKNRPTVLRILFAALVPLFLLVFALLFREAKTAIWLRTRLDYLRLVVMRRHAAHGAGAEQFYRAMERLFALAGMPRSPFANTREFLREATWLRDEMRPAASELTGLFERYRYGVPTAEADPAPRMRRLYQELFQRLRR